MFRRALSTAVFCLFVFGATLAVQGIWSALLVANLQTTPALPWSVPVMAALLWALWSYAGGRWGPALMQAFRARSLRAGQPPRAIFTKALAATESLGSHRPARETLKDGGVDRERFENGGSHARRLRLSRS